MNAIVLCGGRGSRLDAEVEKPLFEVGGRRMLDRVLAALAGSDVDRVHAATSPNAPATSRYVATLAEGGAAAGRRDADYRGRGGEADRSVCGSNAPSGRSESADCDTAFPPIELVETPGDGYVADLEAALDAVGRPAVTVTADLPLLAPEHVDDAIAAADGGERSLAVRVPASLKRLLGVTCERSRHGLAPTGLNVVGPAPDESTDEPPDESTDEPTEEPSDEPTDEPSDEPTGEPSADGTLRSYDARLACNVNALGDARIAEALLEP